MKKIILAISLLSLLVIIFNHPKQEKVSRVAGDILIFESGNWARIFPAGARFVGNNPLDLRSYEKYSYDNRKIEEGLYDYDGNFLPNAEPTESTNFFFFTILMVSATIYLIVFGRNDFIWARDLFNARKDVAITALPQERRNLLLKGKMSCELCNASPDFNLVNETRIQGMVFVEGKCNLCNEQKKVRLK